MRTCCVACRESRSSWQAAQRDPALHRGQHRADSDVLARDGGCGTAEADSGRLSSRSGEKSRNRVVTFLRPSSGWTTSTRSSLHCCAIVARPRQTRTGSAAYAGHLRVRTVLRALHLHVRAGCAAGRALPAAQYGAGGRGRAGLRLYVAATACSLLLAQGLKRWLGRRSRMLIGA